MAELRDIRILIGKRNYRVQTALDDESLQKVIALVTEVAKGFGDGLDQENLLLFTCLHLAYSLEKVSKNLGDFVEELESADSPS